MALLDEKEFPMKDMFVTTTLFVILFTVFIQASVLQCLPLLFIQIPVGSVKQYRPRSGLEFIQLFFWGGGGGRRGVGMGSTVAQW